MTKRTDPPLLNQHFFHHLNQFAIVQNLFDDMGMGLSVIFTVRKTTLPTHLSTPFRTIIKLLYSFSKEMKFLASIHPVLSQMDIHSNHLFQHFSGIQTRP
jgi:hypothetical protein